MPEAVDNKVVEMTFNNARFEQNAQATMSTLEKLKQALSFGKTKNGFDDIQKSADKFHLDSMSRGVDAMSAKFVALATVGITAISNLTNRAVDAGARFAKAFTLDPVSAGFSEYELKINAIQTIMAGSGADLTTVNKKLQELNAYSDKTIYSFADMTQNIGKFTNAGVSLDDSVAAIQGVANVAAISGANAEEAARSMFNFGQAMSTGSIKAIDWKSIELANMATKEFKQELIDSAVAVGTLTKQGDHYVDSNKNVITSTKGFRESLESGWLSTDALTKTLGRYADAGTDIGKRATAAAQDVKTFHQLIDTVKESIGSGWSATAENLFGDFEGAKKLWTGINNVIGSAVGKSAKARNDMLEGWAKFGGRNLLFRDLKTAASSLMDVLEPLRFAFRTLFPKKTAGDLVKMGLGFHGFVESIKRITQTKGFIVGFTRIFGVFFQLIKLGTTIVGGVVKVFTSFFGALLGGGGAQAGSLISTIADAIGKLLRFATGGADKGLNSIAEGAGKLGAKLGSLIGKIMPTAERFKQLKTIIVDFAKTIKNVVTGFAKNAKGDLVKGFEKIPQALDKVRESFDKLKGRGLVNVGRDLIEGLVSGVTSAASKAKEVVIKLADDIITWVKDKLGIHSPSTVMAEIGRNIIDGLLSGVTGVVGAVQRVGTTIVSALVNGLTNAWTAVKEFFGNLSYGVQEAFKGLFSQMDKTFTGGFFDKLMKGGLVAGLLFLTRALHNFSKDGLNINFSFFKEFKKTISDLGDTLKALTLKVKAEALQKLAIALAILIATVAVLYFMNPKKLAAAFAALAVGMAELVALMKAVDKFAGSAGRTGALALSIILFAGAILLLAVAVRLLAGQDIEGLKRGIGAVTALMLALGVTMRVMANNKDIGRVGFKLIGIGLALIILAYAMKQMAKLDWGEIGRGLVGIGGGLVLMVGALKLVGDKEVAKKGLAFLLLAWSLRKFAEAIKLFAAIKFTTLLSGLAKIGLALIVLGIGMRLFPHDMTKQVIDLVLLAGALFIMGKVIQMVGKIKFGDIVKGVLAIVVVLAAVAAAAMLMDAAGPGAALLVVAALGILILAKALEVLANLSIGQLVTSILAMAAALIVVGLASAALGLISPLIAAFGAALLLVGLGVLAFGAGAYLAAIAIEMLAKAGKKGFTALMQVMDMIVASLPHFIDVFVSAFIKTAKHLLSQLPELMKILEAVLTQVLLMIERMVPKFSKTFGKILDAMLKLGYEFTPKFIAFGLFMLESLIQGITDHMDVIVSGVLTMIETFINAVSDNLDGIITAGVNLLVTFLTGMSDAVDEIATAVGILVTAILDAVVDFYGDIATAGTNALLEFLGGLTEDVVRIATAIGTLITTLIEQIQIQATRIADAGAEALAKFLYGIADNINTVCPAAAAVINALVGCLGHLIAELIPGKGVEVIGKFLGGITSKIGDVVGKGAEIIGKVLGGIGSRIGELAGKGAEMAGSLILGIASKFQGLLNAGRSIIDAVVNGFEAGMRIAGQKVRDAAGILANLLPGWVKKILGINSPSKVMAKLGSYAVQGFVLGLSDTTGVDHAASGVVNALTAAMNKLPSMLDNMDELNPRITPVLDLSQVQGEASRLGGMFGVPEVTPSSSYVQARHIANQAAEQDTVITTDAQGVGSLTFIQNNNSPKALGVVDIYRGTKSQLALAREELGIHASQ